MPSFAAARITRTMVAFGLTASLPLPAAAPVAAASPLVLRLGTLEDLDSLNPYSTELTVGFEAFELTYDWLVSFGQNLEPIPGFAESWQRAADGHSWTFKIRAGMTWSDGQPATSADACFSYQLNLDAIEAGANLGVGYIDPNLKDTGATKVECPDPTTMIVTTDDPTNRILQTQIPILPQHIWSKETYKTIGDATFEPPLVGTGPYQVAEWQTGQFVRFVRNKSYWGRQGAEDEIVIQFYKTNDTMVQALKAGEIDYARGISPDQLNQLKTAPNVVTVAGTANGWTELGFNCYGTGTGKTIKGGGPSTKALLDPAFRDALGYAIDKQTLLDRVVGGYGTIGSTPVPPVLTQWHVDPTNPRTFDINLAKQKLDAAGYRLDTAGNRLDKEGKPISLRLVMPDSDPNFPKEAQFIQSWFAELGIKVTPKVYDSATLTELMLPPEAGGASNKASYDLFIWTWAGNADPNGLLQVFECNAIGTASDSNWCDPEYDKLYVAQNTAPTVEARKAILAQLQQLWYDQAPYHILFYDANLAAYRTDHFSGWQNQPPNGTPLFSYSTLGETLLTDATAVPSPTPAPSEVASPGPSSAASVAPSPAPTASAGSGSTGGGSSAGGVSPTVIVIVVIVVVVGVAILWLSRRRRGPAEEDEG